MLKLNLGCGNKKIEGFTGVDIKDADIVADIRYLPFDDDSIDEILSVHVAEHFYLKEIVGVVKEWMRVLKPNGIAVFELPCWDKVIEHVKAGSPDNFTRWAMFGDPRTHVDGEPAIHKWIWSRAEFRKLLEHCGCKDIQEETPHYHQPSRDMRFVCRK